MNIKQQQLYDKVNGGLQGVSRFGKAFYKKSPLFFVIVFMQLVVSTYWLFFATSRYVSEAHVVVQNIDTRGKAATDLTSMTQPVAGSMITKDHFIVRDYLLSTDMLKILDKELDLRTHYTDSGIDIFSRFNLGFLGDEFFHRYYQSRNTIEFDDYTGVLTIRAQAFDPVTANKIASMMIEEGQKFINDVAQKNAGRQVEYMQSQVEDMADRMFKVRQKLVAYQNSKNIMSAKSYSDTFYGVLGDLEKKKSELMTRKQSLLGYLTPTAPDVVDVDIQLRAVASQIKTEQQRLKSEGEGPSYVEEFQRLEQEALVASDLYKSGLDSLHKIRVESLRDMKVLSVVQSATQPVYPMEPRRIFNAFVYSFFIFAMMMIAAMMYSVIRDRWVV